MGSGSLGGSPYELPRNVKCGRLTAPADKKPDPMLGQILISVKSGGFRQVPRAESTVHLGAVSCSQFVHSRV